MTTCEGCEYEEQHCIPRNCIDKSGERKNWTTPAPAPKVHGIDCLFDESKDCKTCEANPKQAPAPAPKVEDEIVDALLEAAQCLDDCLIRIYPEEFSQKHINAAAERFGENCGTIARIATIADKLRSLAQRAGEERYSIPEIIFWFSTKVWIGVNNPGVFSEFIRSPKLGIALVTTRADTRTDRKGDIE